MLRDFRDDYRDITHAMIESVKMGSKSPWSFLEQDADNLFQLELALADNMNMMGFESVDAWYYVEHYLKDTANTDAFLANRNDYKKCFLPHLQFMAKTANRKPLIHRR